MIPPLSRSSIEIRTVSVTSLELRVGFHVMTYAFVLLFWIQASVPREFRSNSTSQKLLTAAGTKTDPLSSESLSVLARSPALVLSSTTSLMFSMTVCSLELSVVSVLSLDHLVVIATIPSVAVPLVRTLSTARFSNLSTNCTSVICVGNVVTTSSDDCIGV